MSKYYKPGRIKNLFDPQSKLPFRLSRSKIELYLNCQRCFYLDRRIGVSQPPGYPFALNSAVDKLLKKEFDIHRAKGSIHPLMKAYGIDAIPFPHENLEHWRNALRGGLQYQVPGTNILVTGAIDDVWVDKQGKIIVVDYKATSKEEEVNLDAEWQIGYKRQMEIYQWLFEKNGFKVSKTGYFVYCNGETDREAFDGKLEFSVKIIPYKGDYSWVDKTVKQAHFCLCKNTLPASSPECDFCAYRKAAFLAEAKFEVV
jgi:CRISPR/Cas system-associated exonuclease Cas4 (RecB family)